MAALIICVFRIVLCSYWPVLAVAATGNSADVIPRQLRPRVNNADSPAGGSYLGQRSRRSVAAVGARPAVVSARGGNAKARTFGFDRPSLLSRARDLVRRHSRRSPSLALGASTNSRRVVAVESGAMWNVPMDLLTPPVQLADFRQAPAVVPTTPIPLAAMVSTTPVTAVAPTTAAAAAPTTPAANAGQTTPVPAAAAAASPTTPAPAKNGTAAASNGTAPETESPGDSPPYIQGPMKILVYGLFFALLYLAVWYARLPHDMRPAAIDEGLMRWIESQEEDEPGGGMNCVLVRVKNAVGIPNDRLPAVVAVECKAFKGTLAIGQTPVNDENGFWNTCLVGPLIDQEQNRLVTMQNAKPEVKFTVKRQAPGEAPQDFAQATIKPGAEASSSSSAAAAGGGITRNSWCCTELKLVAAGGGAMGLMKRVAGTSLGTLNVEVKAMQVNPAGKALLKSNYILIALRKEFIDEKPYSACARTLAVALMGMLTLTSLPIIGDMFSGCFYLSIHGLTTSSSLFLMAIPYWCKFLHIQLPPWIKAMSLDSLEASGAALFTAGWSGCSMVLWWGHGEECSNHFWLLEVLLVVDSLLFSYAWYKGEGGGLMGFFGG